MLAINVALGFRAEGVSGLWQKRLSSLDDEQVAAHGP